MTKQRLGEEDSGLYGKDDLIAQFSTVRVSGGKPKEVLSIPKKPRVVTTCPPGGSTTNKNLLKEMNSPIRPEVLYEQKQGPLTELDSPSSPSVTISIRGHKAPSNVPGQHYAHAHRTTTQSQATSTGHRSTENTQGTGDNLYPNPNTESRDSAQPPNKGKGKAVDESVSEIDGGEETEVEAGEVEDDSTEIITHSSKADVKEKGRVCEVDGGSFDWVLGHPSRLQLKSHDPLGSVWEATLGSVETPEERKTIPAPFTISSNSQSNPTPEPYLSRELTLMDIRPDTTYRKVSGLTRESSPMDTGDDHPLPQFDGTPMDVDTDRVAVNSQSENPLSGVADGLMDVDDPDIIMMDFIPPPPSTTRSSQVTVSRNCDPRAYYRNTPRNAPPPLTGTPSASRNVTYALVAPPGGKPASVSQLSLDTFLTPLTKTASKHPIRYPVERPRILTRSTGSQTPSLSIPPSLTGIHPPAVSQKVKPISASSVDPSESVLSSATPPTPHPALPPMFGVQHSSNNPCLPRHPMHPAKPHESERRAHCICGGRFNPSQPSPTRTLGRVDRRESTLLSTVLRDVVTDSSLAWVLHPSRRINSRKTVDVDVDLQARLSVAHLLPKPRSRLRRTMEKERNLKVGRICPTLQGLFLRACILVKDVSL
ncbi:hypothetical protein PQX77_010789 [Marasmius sp. AFHP31]|nr:hypothetical protein PQX77_010789 [Marasmius sp. AFHP31]